MLREVRLLNTAFRPAWAVALSQSDVLPERRTVPAVPSRNILVSFGQLTVKKKMKEIRHYLFSYDGSWRNHRIHWHYDVGSFLYKITNQYSKWCIKLCKDRATHVNRPLVSAKNWRQNKCSCIRARWKCSLAGAGALCPRRSITSFKIYATKTS